MGATRASISDPVGDVPPANGVLFYDRELFVGEGPRLPEDAVGHTDLAQIVEMAGDAHDLEIVPSERQLFPHRHGAIAYPVDMTRCLPCLSPRWRREAR